MSSVTRPRGPLGQRVYWTRRLIVLALAFGLVFGIAHLLGGGSDGKSGGDTASPVVADASSSSPTTSETTSRPTSGPTTRLTSGPTGTKPPKTNTSPPLAQPDGPCSDDEVVVTPVLSSPVAGSPVAVGLEISSIDSAACTFRVSSSTVVVKLISGDDFIWSSQECPKSVPAVDVVARSSLPAKVNVYWSGRRSNETCSTTTDWARAGWYHAIAAALGGEPTDVQFELALPIGETVTKTASPTQDPSDKASEKASEKASDRASDRASDEPSGRASDEPS